MNDYDSTLKVKIPPRRRGNNLSAQRIREWKESLRENIASKKKGTAHETASHGREPEIVAEFIDIPSDYNFSYLYFIFQNIQTRSGATVRFMGPPTVRRNKDATRRLTIAGTPTEVKMAADLVRIVLEDTLESKTLIETLKDEANAKWRSAVDEGRTHEYTRKQNEIREQRVSWFMQQLQKENENREQVRDAADTHTRNLAQGRGLGANPEYIATQERNTVPFKITGTPLQVKMATDLIRTILEESGEARRARNVTLQEEYDEERRREYADDANRKAMWAAIPPNEKRAADLARREAGLKQIADEREAIEKKRSTAVEIYIQIPVDKITNIIGSRGLVIEYIKRQTGANVDAVPYSQRGVHSAGGKGTKKSNIKRRKSSKRKTHGIKK